MNKILFDFRNIDARTQIRNLLKPQVSDLTTTEVRPSFLVNSNLAYIQSIPEMMGKNSGDDHSREDTKKKSFGVMLKHAACLVLQLRALKVQVASTQITSYFEK